MLHRAFRNGDRTGRKEELSATYFVGVIFVDPSILV